jgi:hypothetical protein
MQTLAEMVADAGTTLAEWVRTICGFPGDTTTLPDLTCTLALTAAVNRINTLDPLLGVGSFTTTAGTQSYTPDLGTSGYSLRQAWWPNNYDEGASDVWPTDPITGQPWNYSLMAAFGQPIDELGTWTSLDPGVVQVVMRNRQSVERMIGVGSATVSNGTTVYLTPCPHHTGHRVYFTYTMRRFGTASAVTEPYWQAMQWAIISQILSAYAVGAGSIKQVVDSQQGTSITLGGGDAAAKRAASAELQFLRCIAVPAVDWLWTGAA